jgi:hypothetical protein
MQKSESPDDTSIADLQRRVKELVMELCPKLRLERKWGHDWFAGTDLVCGVFAFKQYVDVEFWRGSTLPDPSGLLEGTGTNLRHVKVHSILDTQTPSLWALIRAAGTLDQREPKRTR